MEEAIRTAAATKQDLADLINAAIEELVRQRFELPAFSTFIRTAQQICDRVTTTFYRAVNHRLNPASRQQLDALLTIVFENGLRLIAEPSRVMFVEEIGDKPLDLIQAGTVAGKYVETLKLADYQAVGINFRSHNEQFVGGSVAPQVVAPIEVMAISDRTEVIDPALVFSPSGSQGGCGGQSTM